MVGANGLCAQALEANGNKLRNVLSVLGAALIAVGIVVITKRTYFPGWWAALPTVGAVMIISAGTQAWLNRAILSNRVLVWFGLISFPLYLWHWPLLSFARIVQSEQLTLGIRTAAVVISIALSWLTYRLIEKPIRFGKFSKIKAIILCILMVVIGLVGFECYEKDGMAYRIKIEPDTAINLFKSYPHEPFHNKECDVSFPIFKQFNACLLSNNSKPDVVIFGDSHSNQYYKSLAKQLSNNTVMNIGDWNCLPFSSKTHQSNNKCNENFSLALAFLQNEESIKTVYLAGYWNYLAAGGWGIEKRAGAYHDQAIQTKIYHFKKTGSMSFPLLCLLEKMWS